MDNLKDYVDKFYGRKKEKEETEAEEQKRIYKEGEEFISNAVQPALKEIAKAFGEHRKSKIHKGPIMGGIEIYDEICMEEFGYYVFLKESKNGLIPIARISFYSKEKGERDSVEDEIGDTPDEKTVKYITKEDIIHHFQKMHSEYSNY